MGNACWELYCLEHGIRPDGQMPADDSIGMVSLTLTKSTKTIKHSWPKILIKLVIHGVPGFVVQPWPLETDC